MSFIFKKKYGQNFLQDKKVIEKIACSINLTMNDLVIEIGAGAGALTRELKKTNAQILCYEIDEDVREYLDCLEDDRLCVIYDDFLKRDVKKDIANYKYENLYIIGNLPYYITTPIITKIIEDNLIIKEGVFMVQKEVAERFSAKPKSKEYGSITVFLDYYFDIQKSFIVSREKFYPVPNVDSAVIKLSRKNNLLDVDIDKFKKLVRDSFQFKRKNLNNNLKNYDREKINKILERHNLSLSNRAEDLSYEVFVDIANKYY